MPSMARPLAPEDEQLALVLARAGFGERAARCFAALARGHALGAEEAAGATGLARQDVGAAMRELEREGLAVVERVRREGAAGRPAHRYRLAPDARGALARAREARRAALEREMAALDELMARLP